MKIWLFILLLLSIPGLSAAADCPAGFTLSGEVCTKPPVCAQGTYDPAFDVCAAAGTQYPAIIQSYQNGSSVASVFGCIVNNNKIAITYNGATGNYVDLTTGGTSTVTQGEHTLKIVVANQSLQLLGNYVNIQGSITYKTGNIVPFNTAIRKDTTFGLFPKPGSRSVDPNANYPYIYLSSSGLQMGNIQLVNAAIDPTTRVEGSIVVPLYSCNAGDTLNGSTCTPSNVSENPDCGPGILDGTIDLCVADPIEALLTSEQAAQLIEKFTLIKSALEIFFPALVGCSLVLIFAATWRG